MKKILFIGAMEKELRDLIGLFGCIEKKKLLNKYPFFLGKWSNNKRFEIGVLLSFVGDTNAAVSSIVTIKEFDPDYVFKVGCVGGTSPGIHKSDIIVPLGFFHSGSWITRSNKDNSPTSDASLWQSVFGKKPYQVNDQNLGYIPYYFQSSKELVVKYESLLQRKKQDYHKAHIGGGNMWFFERNFMENVAKNVIPQDSGVKHWVSDMESFAIAHTCFVTKKSFMGFYVVSNSDYYEDEEYVPEEIRGMIKNKLVTNIPKYIALL
ncbi:MAG: hypothetical protein ABIH76_07470 [Candidatus Bathyarchaeota archaeon]